MVEATEAQVARVSVRVRTHDALDAASRKTPVQATAGYRIARAGSSSGGSEEEQRPEHGRTGQARKDSSGNTHATHQGRTAHVARY